MRQLFAEALRYCATCAQNNIVEIAKNEFAKLNKAGLKDVLSKLTQASEKKEANAEEVSCTSEEGCNILNSLVLIFLNLKMQ